MSFICMVSAPRGGVLNMNRIRVRFLLVNLKKVPPSRFSFSCRYHCFHCHSWTAPKDNISLCVLSPHSYHIHPYPLPFSTIPEHYEHPFLRIAPLPFELNPRGVAFAFEKEGR